MAYISEILEEFEDKVIRYWKYNKFSIFTPEQQDRKYTDESLYLDPFCDFGRIVNAWDTKNGILLKINRCDESYPFESFEMQEYIYLNDICLMHCDCDDKNPLDDDELVDIPF